MKNRTTRPWHHFTAQVHDNNRRVIARLPTGEGCVSIDERAGNISLITYAPDLLEALKDLLNVIATDELIPESVSYMQQARAAVAKAEGEHE